MPRDKIDDENKIIHMPDGVLRGPNAQETVSVRMSDAEKLMAYHRAAAPMVVKTIIDPIAVLGGGGPQIMQFLESVVVGVIMMTSPSAMHDKVVDVLAASVKAKLVEVRKRQAEIVIDKAFAGDRKN